MGRTANLVLLGALLACAEGFPQRRAVVPVTSQRIVQQTVGANVGTVQTAVGPFVAVGTSAANIVGDSGGVQAVSAATQLRAGGGFSFGSNQVTSTAERAGSLPVQASSRSTVVSTSETALGSSQASTLSTQPSNQPGVPSTVSAAQSQVSAFGVRGGLTSQQRHIGRIEVGPNGPRASIGGVVERQISQAGQQANLLGVTTRRLHTQAAGFRAQTTRSLQGTRPAVQVTVTTPAEG